MPEREPEISLPLLKEFVSDLVNLYSLTIYCLARKFEVVIHTNSVLKGSAALLWLCLSIC